MPVFRRGNATINLPEGSSYICKGSRDTAEYRICPGMEIGKYYKVRCENGKLSYVEVKEPVRGDKERGDKERGDKERGI